ncbi:hypothetical protein PG996_012304 [Apiospora saccharicola]|uniref:Uncharacterized protein n=1 Tax=Apiospora saccharicola TaxID=335842 RepID=A0ABR1U2G0_9PEZI
MYPVEKLKRPWRSAGPDELSDEPGAIRVRMIAHLSDGSRKTLDSLKEWATKSRPPCVKRIKIDHVEPAGSGMVTFSIPVSVWANLPDHPGFKTIAFIGDIREIVVPPRVLGSSTNLPERPSEKRQSLGGLGGSENKRPS